MYARRRAKKFRHDCAVFVYGGLWVSEALTNKRRIKANANANEICGLRTSEVVWRVRARVCAHEAGLLNQAFIYAQKQIHYEPSWRAKIRLWLFGRES